ncbi:MAG: hypothetical protein LBQ86_07445 [Holophagales bacterium]|jgi:hypothetical protein|nr:hypothetical protein [Holophagales bacterium]
MSLGKKLKMYFRMTFLPLRTFAELAEQPQTLWNPFGWMLLFRVPLAWIFGVINYTWLLLLQQAINDPPQSAIRLLEKLKLQPGDVLSELQTLPPLPPLSAAWPWIGLLALLGIIGLWMHNVAWDHLSLWMLRGTRQKPSVRASGAAIAEAMGAAFLGSFFGLFLTVPILGLFVAPILVIVNVYYWALRGISLAKYHGCRVWKGIAATLLHVFLAILVYGILFYLFGLIAMDAALRAVS